MDISRHDFLKVSGGVASGTALGGLAGLGANLAPTLAQAEELRVKNAKTVPSICPYCSVGCATLVQTIDGKIVNIEGDPRSPFSEGTLRPKGTAIYQLHVNPNRPTQVLHRAPGATEWEVWDLERAMTRVAELTKKTRDETFVERLENGKVEACAVCHAYLKSIMTLTPTPPAEVAVLDLATVDLDVAALGEGYARPAHAAAPLHARVVARERRRVLAWLG